ncbi:uncharacterized protein [Littorina saxatilis]|uniref:uncharacterized protein n=1 Tax=Littorina saxatilis TaxID=31220 RepID=UPI0038B49013
MLPTLANESFLPSACGSSSNMGHPRPPSQPLGASSSSACLTVGMETVFKGTGNIVYLSLADSTPARKLPAEFEESTLKTLQLSNMMRMMILSSLAFVALLQVGTAASTMKAPVPLPSEVANPCTQTAIDNEKFYFPYPGEVTKFIQCDGVLNAYVLLCRPGTEFSQVNTTCVNTPPTANSVCQTVGQLVPDNCNHHDFFQCNGVLSPVRLACPNGLFFNPTALYCDFSDVNTVTC